MDAEALRHWLNVTVDLIKKNDYTVLRGFIKEIYLDSILFVSQGRERLISFSEIAEIRELNRNPVRPPTKNFYYNGNGESWKR